MVIQMKKSRLIARVYGLVGILFTLALLASGSGITQVIESMSDPGIVFLWGFITLLIGVATVVGHHVWEKSWRVAITIVGYIALLKGFVLIAWPNVLIEMAQDALENGEIPVRLLIGAFFYGWMTWMGFRPEKEEPVSELVETSGE
jgi:hypothetical protein